MSLNLTEIWLASLRNKPAIGKIVDGKVIPSNGKYYAYDHRLPCLNPRCKSHGIPHPNCKCYGGQGVEYAEGGEVESFCSKDNAHKEDCEYFDDGGVAGQSQAAFDPSSATAESGPEDPTPTPTPTPGPTSSPQQSFDPSSATAEFDPSSAEQEESPYGTTKQMGATFVEGMGRGAAGPLSTAAEIGLGVPREDIAGREEENPWTNGLGELTGQGLSIAAGLGVGSEVLNAATAVSNGLGIIGKGIIGGAISSGLLKGSDEISDALLNKGDPNNVVAPILINSAIATGIGAIGGGLISGVSSGVGAGAKWIAKKAEMNTNFQLGTKLQNWFSGWGYAAQQASKSTNPLAQEAEADFNNAASNFDKEGMEEALNRKYQILEPQGKNTPEFNDGVKSLWSIIPNYSSQISLGMLGAYEGYEQNGIPGMIYGGATGAVAGKALNMGLGITNKILGKGVTKLFVPAVMGAITNDDGQILPRIGAILNHVKTLDGGLNMANSAVNGIFQQSAHEAITNPNIDKLKEFLRKDTDNGGINQHAIEQQSQDNQSQLPHLADGGLVQPQTPTQPQAPTQLQKGDVSPLLAQDDPIAKYYPQQSVMLQTARGRVSNYLNSIRPQPNPQMLPFDRKPDQKEQEKTYDRALGIAAHPLEITNRIREGRLTAQDMTHFTSMYPEVHSYLKGKITDRIVQAQLNNEKPPTQVRQSLSLFMGAPLESTLKQPMIAAAQATFSAQGQQPDQGGGGPKSTKDLGKVSKNYQTAADASAARASQTE